MEPGAHEVVVSQCVELMDFLNYISSIGTEQKCPKLPNERPESFWRCAMNGMHVCERTPLCISVPLIWSPLQVKVKTLLIGAGIGNQVTFFEEQ